MFNTYAVLNINCQNMVIPGKAIYHYSMDKYIKNRYNVEKDEFLVILPYVTYTKTYQVPNYWIENNYIPTIHARLDADTNKYFKIFEINIALSDLSHNEKLEIDLNK